MKVKNLESMLISFINDDFCRTLLIDGKWGCGKTHQFIEFLRKYNNGEFEYDSTPIYYISLFGLKSLDEIDKLLYKKINYVKRCLLAILRFFSHIFVSNSIRQGKIVTEVSRQLDNYKESAKIRKPICVVFDDLERLGDNVGYIELFGYLNNLLRSDTKFICLCDTSKIGLIRENDKERRLDFDSFKEKIFDRVININEKPKEIISDIFEPYKIKGMETLIDNFGDNIRNAIKTQRLFDSVKAYLCDNGLEMEDYTLLLSCINVIKILFEKHQKPENLDTGTLIGTSYQINSECFGEDIANGIYQIEIQNNKNYGDARDKYFMPILKAYYFDDYEELKQMLYKPKVDVNKNDEFKAIDNNLFYLSDEDNIKASESFIQNIRKGEFVSDRAFYNKLIELMRFSIVPITHEIIDEICDSIIHFSEPKDIFIDHIEMCLKSDSQNQENIDYLYNSLSNKLKIAKEENTIFKLDDLYKKGDYEKILKIFEENYFLDSFKKSKDIVEIIKRNNFLLPDFKKSFDEYTWHVCHSLSEYMVKIGLEDELFEYFKKEASENLNNITYINKLKALCYYRLNREDEFSEYISDLKNSKSSEK